MANKSIAEVIVVIEVWWMIVARSLQRRPDLNIPETNVHNKEVSRGERLTSTNLTFAIVLACIEERSYVAANLLFDVCLPTSNGTHRSRKQEPRSYEWLAAYGRLTACSYPLQSQAHNMLASWSAVDHGRTFHRARNKSFARLESRRYASHRTGPT